MAAYDKPDGGGIVTKADFELDRLIGSALRQRFPDDALLTEESPDDGERHRRSRCWMIDPIDGTRDYAGGLDSWAIHIGLCIDGVPSLGLVAEPAIGRTTWGIAVAKQREAWSDHDGETIAIRSRAGGSPLRLVSPRRREDPKIRGFITALPAGHTRRLGSVGIKLCDVARGSVDVYLHPSSGTSMWDTCAPQAILEAAGARLSDVTGKLLRHDGPTVRHGRGLLAAASTVHGHAVASVHDELRRWAEKHS